MTHHINSSRRIGSRLAVNVLCAACVAVLLYVATDEAIASVMYLAGAESEPVVSVLVANKPDIGDRVFEERMTQPIGSSRPGKPIEVAVALPDSRHERVADSGRSSLWIGQDTAHATINQFSQDLAAYGSPHALDGSVDRRSRSPVVPVSAPPSSGLLFVTALVGMLGTVTAVRGESRFKRALPASDCDPPRLCPPVSVAVLSSDAALARDLEERLHRAGYEVRIAAAVSEIFAVTDPASLLLIIVDRRTQDWDMLRTDSSLRHVLLMAVVPPDCFYTECHFIADLERGMDGVHDLRDGHRLLVAKVGAYLRRAGCDTLRRGIYQVGAVELDGDAHEVTIAGRQVRLSAKPFAILSVLMREPSKVFSRNVLLDLVWGPNIIVGEHTVDVHVHVLRQLLDREPNRLCELVTINRVGFTLRPVSSAGSLRTNRPRPMSNFISDSHTRASMTPRLMSRRITPRTHRVLTAPPLNSPANTCMTSPCG